MGSLLAPKRLDPRKELLARRIASGVKPEEAAVSLGFTKNQVRTLMKSPLFVALVDHISRQVMEAVTTRAVDRIVEETDKTIDRVVDLRDQNFDRGVALGACKTFLDRQVPIVHKSESASVLRVSISRADLSPMDKALNEMGETLEITDADIVGDENVRAIPNRGNGANDANGGSVDAEGGDSTDDGLSEIVVQPISEIVQELRDREADAEGRW